MTKNNQRILLIDDDEKLGKLLGSYFSQFDIELIQALLPSEGFQLNIDTQPNLIILDVMLPEMDGFEVCKRIRQRANTPIIMLTARGDVNDRVVGLASGADDYLPKPFEPEELLARIQNILARIDNASVTPQENIIECQDITINRNSHEVFVKGQAISLTSKEYALLILMVENPDKIFNRDDIMNELSGIDSELFSRSVDILVSRLRNKIKPLDYIETVWGIGYRFSAH